MEEKKEQIQVPSLSEEEMKLFMEARRKHEQRKATNPEYRAEWERKTKEFDRVVVPLMGDSIEME